MPPSPRSSGHCVAGAVLPLKPRPLQMGDQAGEGEEGDQSL